MDGDHLVVVVVRLVDTREGRVEVGLSEAADVCGACLGVCSSDSRPVLASTAAIGETTGRSGRSGRRISLPGVPCGVAGCTVLDSSSRWTMSPEARRLPVCRWVSCGLGPADREVGTCPGLPEINERGARCCSDGVNTGRPDLHGADDPRPRVTEVLSAAGDCGLESPDLRRRRRRLSAFCSSMLRLNLKVSTLGLCGVSRKLLRLATGVHVGIRER
jgi:hypothetical protein